ncbi:hypothetical protein LINPERPRIM_LOCUS18800 [Linum perenne]
MTPDTSPPLTSPTPSSPALSLPSSAESPLSLPSLSSKTPSTPPSPPTSPPAGASSTLTCHRTSWRDPSLAHSPICPTSGSSICKGTASAARSRQNLVSSAAWSRSRSLEICSQGQSRLRLGISQR